MSVGIQEIAITFIVACFVAVVTRRRAEGNVLVWQNRKWLWGVCGIFAIASAASPADPASSLVFAVPVSVVYVTALLRMERRLTPVGD